MSLLKNDGCLDHRDLSLIPGKVYMSHIPLQSLTLSEALSHHLQKKDNNNYCKDIPRLDATYGKILTCIRTFNK